MALYDFGAAVILGTAGIRSRPVGIAVWLAVMLHASDDYMVHRESSRRTRGARREHETCNHCTVMEDIAMSKRYLVALAPAMLRTALATPVASQIFFVAKLCRFSSTALCPALTIPARPPRG
jgi:hypothetical protein